MRPSYSMGAWIRARREQAGLSQRALAEALGVKQQTVQKWEADGATPAYERLPALRDALGVTDWEMLDLIGLRPGVRPAGTNGEGPPIVFTMHGVLAAIDADEHLTEEQKAILRAAYQAARGRR